MSAPGTDACTVTLKSAAGSAGVTVTLASNNAIVQVPATVTIADGDSSAGFTATASAVSSLQTVGLTAVLGSQTLSYSLQVRDAAPALAVDASSVAFGNVTLNSPKTQSVILSSTGGSALTIDSATLDGNEFSVSGATFPVVLQPGQSVTLELAFTPTVLGAATGSVVIASNAASGATTTIGLTGTGVALAYQVDLAWQAPAKSADPIAGYRIYRAAGSGAYVLLNSSLDAATSYIDATVENGVSYDYYVESVDGSGMASAPSNTFAVTIP